MSYESDQTTETIRVIRFKGKDQEWREWALKTKAVGQIKGWWNELEATEELDLKSSTKEMKERISKNDAAYHYLLLACTGDAFPYVEAAEGLARKAWNSLKQRYEASESTDLIELIEKFNTSRLKTYNQNLSSQLQTVA